MDRARLNTSVTSQQPVTSTIILMGRNDAACLGTGWHPVQPGPAGVPCRWMSASAEITPPPGQHIASLTVTVSAPNSIDGQSPGLSLYHGDALLGHTADLGQEGQWIAAIIPLSDTLDISTLSAPALRLVVENRDAPNPRRLAFVPHAVLGNGDLRELAIQVSTIRFTHKD